LARTIIKLLVVNDKPFYRCILVGLLVHKFSLLGTLTDNYGCRTIDPALVFPKKNPAALVTF
jgi:hypothetical protein